MVRAVHAALLRRATSRAAGATRTLTLTLTVLLVTVAWFAALTEAVFSIVPPFEGDVVWPETWTRWEAPAANVLQLQDS